MFDFINIRNEPTFAKTNYTLITRGNAVFSLFNLYKNVTLNTDIGVCPQQIQLETFLRTMKIKDWFIVYYFHSKRDGNHIGILSALHCDPHSITSVKNVKYFFFVLNFSLGQTGASRT